MRFSPVWSPDSFGDGFARLSQDDPALAVSLVRRGAGTREAGLREEASDAVQARTFDWGSDLGDFAGLALDLPVPLPDGGGLFSYVYPSEATITAGLLYPSFYWVAGQYTYSIPTTGSTWPGYPGAPSEPLESEYAVLSAAQGDRFRVAIGLWDDLIAPEYTEVTEPGSVGHIRVAFTDVDTLSGSSVWGYAYTPPDPAFSPTAKNGDVWIDFAHAASGFTAGSFDFLALLHELGHSMGLKHPFDGASTIPTEFDTRRFTVMSYTNTSDFLYRTFTPTGGGGLSASATGVYASTLMVFDILAIQTRYGADTGTRAGDTTYSWSQATPMMETVYDAGGIDTFDLSANTRGSIVDLTPGQYSSIAKWSVADQTAYYISLYPGASSFITSWMGGATTYTWTDNVGIAFGTIIENVVGSSGNDTITGNTAANTISGGAGADILDGGAGTDTISAASDIAAAFIQLAWAWARDGWGTEDRLTSFENITGSAFSDVLIGYTGANTITGGAGNDWIEDVGDGADVLHGEAGNDIVWGGVGDDTLFGEADNDALLGGTGNDTLDGGTGVDWIYAGLGADTITGGTGDDVLFGAEGGGPDASSDLADAISGGDGIDALIGEGGDDILDGGADDDWAYGGIGNDTITGGTGADRLAGEDGNDVISGGDGNDFVYGAFGDDIVDGGAGNDWVEGSFGNDVITGGMGADSLFGGGGDRFVYTATAESTEALADVIGVFWRPGGDKIDVSAIDANAFAPDGDTAFTHVVAFSGFAGQMIISFDGTNSVARFDTNGDALADMAIVVLGVSLVAGDFIL